MTLLDKCGGKRKNYSFLNGISELACNFLFLTCMQNFHLVFCSKLEPLFENFFIKSLWNFPKSYQIRFTNSNNLHPRTIFLFFQKTSIKLTNTGLFENYRLQMPHSFKLFIFRLVWILEILFFLFSSLTMTSCEKYTNR